MGTALALALRYGVAGVLLFAALPKILEPGPFAESIANYQLISGKLAGLAAVLVPMMEFVLALGLITGVALRGAALGSLGLLFVFTVAIAQALIRDINIDCGCFGSAAESEVGWQSLVRNALLMGACMLVLLLPRQGTEP